MERPLALGLAIGTAALAVVLVAVDLQYNVIATLEVQEDGQWTAIASRDVDGGGYADERFVGCAGPEMRVRIDNGLPWSRSIEVRAFVYNGAGEQVILDQVVRVAGGASETVAFTVPPEAVDDRFEGRLNNIALNVEVGDAYLGTCVEVPQ